MEIHDLIRLLEKSGYSGNLEINPLRTFSDNGIDSLDLFALLSVLDEEYNVSIEDDELSLIRTPGELLEFANKKINPG